MRFVSILSTTVIAAVALTACATGKPNGFGAGDSWAIPVVGALEDGQFIAPVMIQGKGPYLFLLQPRTQSLISRRVAKELDLYIRRTDTRLVDASDTFVEEMMDVAEVPAFAVGDLTVEQTTFVVREPNLTFRGRPIVGTLGGELFADSLVWTFDRDRQVVYLATQEAAPARPGDAVEVEAEAIRGGKFFVEARLNDTRDAYVYVLFPSLASAVWPSLAEKAGLDQLADSAWLARTLALGAASVDNIPIFAFQDARVRQNDYDGFIGLDVLSRFRVTVNWHRETLWLQPRAREINAVLDERLARWGDRFDTCAEPACVTVTMNREGDAPSIEFNREPELAGVAYDVLVQAVDEDGRPVDLPRLLVVFDANTNAATVSGPDAARFQAAANFRVIDATPFPFECDGACVIYADQAD